MISDPKTATLSGEIFKLIDEATGGAGLAWLRDSSGDTFVTAESELRSEGNVIKLFDLSRSYEAAITARGWRELLRQHGWDRLCRMATQSTWFGHEDEQEAQESIRYFSRTAGYDPDRDSFGTFDEVVETFTSVTGESWRVS